MIHHLQNIVLLMTQDIRLTNTVKWIVGQHIVQPYDLSQNKYLIASTILNLKLLDMQRKKARETDTTFISQKASWESLRCWYWLSLLTIRLDNIDKGIWGCYDGRMKKVRHAEAMKRGAATGKGVVETCQDSAALTQTQWAYERSGLVLTSCWR